MSPEDAAELSEKLRNWSQGDCILGPVPFVYLKGEFEDGEPEYTIIEDLAGVVVITQTCDILNVAPSKNTVAVCPLIKVSQEQYKDSLTGRTPMFAAIENLSDQALVADLNLVMSIDKKMLAKFDRTAGFSSEQAGRVFAECLERKHGRFAFPDDFVDSVLRPLRTRFLSWNNKESDNGRLLKAIKTARVRAMPSWNAQGSRILFYFFLEKGSPPISPKYKKIMEDAFKKIAPLAPFSFDDPSFEFIKLQDISAEEYLESNDVDWDFMSRGL